MTAEPCEPQQQVGVIDDRDFTYMVTETMKNMDDSSLRKMVRGQIKSNFGVSVADEEQENASDSDEGE